LLLKIEEKKPSPELIRIFFDLVIWYDKVFIETFFFKNWNEWIFLCELHLLNWYIFLFD
jgi:hypothetical protein